MGLLERRRLLLQIATNRALEALTETESRVLEVEDQTIFNPTEEQVRAAEYVSEEEILPSQNF